MRTAHLKNLWQLLHRESHCRLSLVSEDDCAGIVVLTALDVADD